MCVCDAATQSNNMLISIGKVFRFLIIFSQSLCATPTVRHSCLSHRDKPTFNTCGVGKRWQIELDQRMFNKESN